MTHSLDQIVDLLSRNRQRATYGAVAELMGANPRKLMGGRPKDHPNSWVVAEKDGRPTGYGPEEVDPALIVRMRVINTKEDLEVWLTTAKVPTAT